MWEVTAEKINMGTTIVRLHKTDYVDKMAGVNNIVHMNIQEPKLTLICDFSKQKASRCL